MRLKPFGKTLAGLCLVAGLESCVSPTTNLVITSPRVVEQVEKANEVSVSEIPKKFNKALCEAGVPRRFVQGLTIKFSSELGKGETDYNAKTRTILINPDLKFVDWYSMSGFAHQFGLHVLSNVFSEKETVEFETLVDNYEQRAYPLFIGLDLRDSSRAVENLEKCAFIEPLRQSEISEQERRAEIMGYLYSDPYKETWNYDAIGKNKVDAINSGRERFSSEFLDFLKRFGNEKPKIKDVKFVVE